MHDKPIIFGSTRDEEKLFMVFDEYFINRPLGFLSWVDSRFNFYITDINHNVHSLYGKSFKKNFN